MVNKNSYGALLKQINGELEKRANNSLRSYNLTMSQVEVLLALRDAKDQQMPLKQIEQVFHIAQSTAAGIVSRLEQKGFVEGFGDPEDHRVKIARLTATGLECCREADQNMMETEKEILSALTETEQSVFQALLQKLRDSLQ